jgi:hypothetical protein
MRRLGVILGVLVLAAAGAFAAVSFFNARDDAGVGTADAGPGVPVAQLGALAGRVPHLPDGNVVVLYADPAQRAPLEALGEQIAGAPSADLEAAGQAVVVRREPEAGGVVAVAGGRALRASGPSDPALRSFVERSLGRG